MWNNLNIFNLQFTIASGTIEFLINLFELALAVATLKLLAIWTHVMHKHAESSGRSLNIFSENFDGTPAGMSDLKLAGDNF